jgi:hypothetical protein
MDTPAEHLLEGLHCTMAIERPAHAVVIVRITGRDVGELGERPFDELARALTSCDRMRLFIDARQAQGPSVEVSAQWATWLAEHRDRLDSVTMLTGSRLVRLTADFVRRFAGMGDRMRVLGEALAFDTATALAMGAA